MAGAVPRKAGVLGLPDEMKERSGAGYVANGEVIVDAFLGFLRFDFRREYA